MSALKIEGVPPGWEVSVTTPWLGGKIKICPRCSGLINPPAVIEYIDEPPKICACPDPWQTVVEQGAAIEALKRTNIDLRLQVECDCKGRRNGVTVEGHAQFCPANWRRELGYERGWRISLQRELEDARASLASEVSRRVDLEREYGDALDRARHWAEEHGQLAKELAELRTQDRTGRRICAARYSVGGGVCHRSPGHDGDHENEAMCWPRGAESRKRIERELIESGCYVPSRPDVSTLPDLGPRLCLHIEWNQIQTPTGPIACALPAGHPGRHRFGFHSWGTCEPCQGTGVPVAEPKPSGKCQHCGTNKNSDAKCCGDELRRRNDELINSIFKLQEDLRATGVPDIRRLLGVFPVACDGVRCAEIAVGPAGPIRCRLLIRHDGEHRSAMDVVVWNQGAQCGRHRAVGGPCHLQVGHAGECDVGGGVSTPEAAPSRCEFPCPGGDGETCQRQCARKAGHPGKCSHRGDPDQG